MAGVCAPRERGRMTPDGTPVNFFRASLTLALPHGLRLRGPLTGNACGVRTAPAGRVLPAPDTAGLGTKEERQIIVCRASGLENLPLTYDNMVLIRKKNEKSNIFYNYTECNDFIECVLRGFSPMGS